MNILHGIYADETAIAVEKTYFIHKFMPPLGEVIARVMTLNARITTKSLGKKRDS